jgi:isochorismate synthase EntC
MFDQRSRYRDVENAKHVTESGRVVVYRRRRILPIVDEMQMRGSVQLIPNERIDHLAARTVGDPLQFWQLCDANGAMHPTQLFEAAQGQIVIPQPQFKTTR